MQKYVNFKSYCVENREWDKNTLKSFVNEDMPAGERKCVFVYSCRTVIRSFSSLFFYICLFHLLQLLIPTKPNEHGDIYIVQ